MLFVSLHCPGWHLASSMYYIGVYIASGPASSSSNGYTGIFVDHCIFLFRHRATHGKHMYSSS